LAGLIPRVRACFANTFDLPLDVKETKSVFKVGLNFLFNGVGKGPVRAAY
jgi:hypothetical protein